MKKTYILLLLSVLFSCCEAKQNNTTADIYNLNFRRYDDSNFKWIKESTVAISIDEKEIVGGKNPLVFTSIIDKNQLPYFGIVVHQSIPLPKLAKNKTIELSINNKCIGLDEIMFKYIALDNERNVLCVDSVNINNGEWTKNKLVVCNNNVSQIIIGILGIGFEKAGIDMSLWIDRISLTVDGKDIYAYEQSIDTVTVNINNENIISVDSGNLVNISVPKEKKIVALGGQYGCKTTNLLQIEMLKKLIEENNCRLVIFALNAYQLLKWNLFVTNLLPANTIDEIREDSYSAFFDNEALCEFLLWLRNYNKSAESPVKIAGNMDKQYEHAHHVIEYINSLYSKKTSNVLSPLIKMLDDGSIEKAIQYMDNTPQAREFIGENNYPVFRYLLGVAIRNFKQRASLRKTIELIFYDDYSMWLNTRNLINLLLKETETVAMVLDFGQINRKNIVFPNPYSVGYYCEQDYKNKYFAIEFMSKAGNSMNIYKSEPEKTVMKDFYNQCNNLPRECFYSSFTENDKRFYPLNGIDAFVYISSGKFNNIGEINQKMEAAKQKRMQKVINIMENINHK